MKVASVFNWIAMAVVFGMITMVKVFAQTTNFFESELIENQIVTYTDVLQLEKLDKKEVKEVNLLHGKVIDLNTGAPLSGVKVTIGSHDGINEDQFSTCKDGLFSFDYDQSKKYVAIAAKSSYSNESLFFAPPTIGLGDTLIIRLRRE